MFDKDKKRCTIASRLKGKRSDLSGMDSKRSLKI